MSQGTEEFDRHKRTLKEFAPKLENRLRIKYENEFKPSRLDKVERAVMSSKKRCTTCTYCRVSYICEAKTPGRDVFFDPPQNYWAPTGDMCTTRSNCNRYAGYRQEE